MNAVFADTFYWIALTNQLDSLHQQALSLVRSLDAPQIITTEQVLSEYLNFFAEWGAYFRRKAAINVRDVLLSANVSVIPESHESFIAGLALYEARSDKSYSVTDCISMNAMRDNGLTEVLTNDRHFEQEGFRVLFRTS